MYGGIEGLFEADRWIVAALWCWIGVGMLLAMVSRSAMVSRLRHGSSGSDPLASPYMVRRHLLRSYVTFYGFDSNAGAFCAAVAMILSGFGGLVVMHQRLGV